MTFTLVVAVMVAAATGCGSEGGNHSASYDLATLDNNVEPSGENDPALAPYRTDLQALHRLCRDHPSPGDIGDEVLKTQDLLASHKHVHTTLLDILTGAVSVHRALNGSAGTCPEVFALIIATH